MWVMVRGRCKVLWVKSGWCKGFLCVLSLVCNILGWCDGLAWSCVRACVCVCVRVQVVVCVCVCV